MFYVIEIATGDERIAGKAVYEYLTEKEAVASFHSRLGTGMKSDLYTSGLVVVMDDNGRILKREKFTNVVINPDVEGE